MRRATFLGMLAVVLLGLVLQAPQNAILITVDTLRADVLGYAGGPARTPHLDGFAAESWRFDRCIAASMLTNPAHASLMTSLYPHEHGVFDNNSGIGRNVPTLATALQAHGWHTGAVLNFRHLNPEVSHLGQGFEHIVRAGVHERRAAQTSAAALKLIDSLPQPFFVWLHYTDPHAPYDAETLRDAPPSKDLRNFVTAAPMTEVRRAAPHFQRDNPWFAQVFAAYASSASLVRGYIDEVESVDAGLGDLFEGLKGRNLTQQTVVVVTADHGENLGEHGLFFHHGGLYDSTVHVPLIVHTPTAAPQVLAGLVASVDIAPTLLDLLRVNSWAPVSGRSFVAYARGIGGAEPRPFAFSEHMLGQLLAVRSNSGGTLIVHQSTSHQFPSYPFHRGHRELWPRDLGPTATADLDAALSDFSGRPKRYVAVPAPAVNREALRSLGYTD